MSAHVSATTKRQAVLLERLVTFCERCGSPDLPMRVDRVIGYGSFFRGKERPADVDLLVVVGARHPDFERFSAIVEKLEKEMPTDIPADRIRKFACAHSDPAIRASADLFCSWLSLTSTRDACSMRSCRGSMPSWQTRRSGAPPRSSTRYGLPSGPTCAATWHESGRPITGTSCSRRPSGSSGRPSDTSSRSRSLTESPSASARAGSG